jgi:Fe-S cluster assembly ATP-binding protein
VFLAFQYPVEIPGVNNAYFLKTALNAQRKAAASRSSTMEFLKLEAREAEGAADARRVAAPRVNEGFSGGEKKRNEIFQMACSSPAWPSSTKPTPASTSTRCASSPRA